MNTQYFRGASLRTELASGKRAYRAYIRLPRATPVSTNQPLSGKQAVVEVANLATALFVNWLCLGLVVGLSILLAG